MDDDFFQELKDTSPQITPIFGASEHTSMPPSLNIGTNPICCLCGFEESCHGPRKGQCRHRFFKTKPEYLCRICHRYFYEHDHMREFCFYPYKRLNYK